jgi:acyl dehydratase
MSQKEIIQVGTGLCWDQLNVGDVFRTYGRTITDTDITNYINVTGMNEVLLTNMEFLSKHSVIKNGRPVPAALVYSVAEGLIIQGLVQGVALAFLSMDFNVVGPVLAGDTVHVEVEVIEVKQTSKGNNGLVRTKNNIVNQRGDVVIAYTPLRMLKHSTNIA